jgi:hypothetical protein
MKEGKRVFDIVPVTGVPYGLYEVLVDGWRCGGYLVLRTRDGVATAGSGSWWAGIGWLDGPEHGPYRTPASARKAVVTDQVLTPALRERGW